MQKVVKFRIALGVNSARFVRAPEKQVVEKEIG